MSFFMEGGWVMGGGFAKEGIGKIRPFLRDTRPPQGTGGSGSGELSGSSRRRWEK
jgi:hypothetical protein